MRRLLVLLVLASAVLAPGAGASQVISTSTVTGLTLGVNSKGEALLTYKQGGKVVHVLAWGAVNAIPPTPTGKQVAFQLDYSGGFDKYYNEDAAIQKLRKEFAKIRYTPGYLANPVTKKLQQASQYASNYWNTGGFACGKYDGPALAWLVTACKAPDGSYWAVQSWQRRLPHRGIDPWQPVQGSSSFDVSHWSGDIASVSVYVDWPRTFNYETEQIFGRMTYAGQPVHGFRTTASGAPTDGYGRGLYIDTLDSAYGAGWKRETSIVFRNPSGSFCYSFYPTNDVSLPGRPSRPAGNGSRYRISAMGPGVTPDVEAEADGIGRYDSGSAADAELERNRLSLYDDVTAGDKFCATQR